MLSKVEGSKIKIFVTCLHFQESEKNWPLTQEESSTLWIRGIGRWVQGQKCLEKRKVDVEVCARGNFAN